MYPLAQKFRHRVELTKFGVCVSIGFSFSKGESFSFMLLVQGCIFSHNLTWVGRSNFGGSLGSGLTNCSFFWSFQIKQRKGFVQAGSSILG